MISIKRSVNFGKSKTGLSTVGFTVYNGDGTTYAARSTVGVVEMFAGTGIYYAPVSISDTFSGYVLWDTGEVTPVFASENIDYRSFVATSGSSGGSGGYAIIETWNKKEKEKIMANVEKILKIVKALSTRTDKSVLESLATLKNSNEKSVESLRGMIVSEVKSINEKLGKETNVDLINENLEILGEALNVILHGQEFERVIGEVRDNVTSEFN